MCDPGGLFLAQYIPKTITYWAYTYKSNGFFTAILSPCLLYKSTRINKHDFPYTN